MRHDGTSNGLRALAIGLLLALLLTALPFALVAWAALDRRAVLALIALAALLQAAVHLRLFLGISTRSTPRAHLLALAFATVLIVIMIGGSLWIAIDLHHRMALSAP